MAPFLRKFLRRLKKSFKGNKSAEAAKCSESTRINTKPYRLPIPHIPIEQQDWLARTSELSNVNLKRRHREIDGSLQSELRLEPPSDGARDTDSSCSSSRLPCGNAVLWYEAEASGQSFVECCEPMPESIDREQQPVRLSFGSESKTVMRNDSIDGRDKGTSKIPNAFSSSYQIRTTYEESSTRYYELMNGTQTDRDVVVKSGNATPTDKVHSLSPFGKHATHRNSFHPQREPSNNGLVVGNEQMSSDDGISLSSVSSSVYSTACNSLTEHVPCHAMSSKQTAETFRQNIDPNAKALLKPILKTSGVSVIEQKIVHFDDHATTIFVIPEHLVTDIEDDENREARS